MVETLENLSQITLYLKDEFSLEKRVNQIALFQHPFTNQHSVSIKKWRITPSQSPTFFNKLKDFLFKRLHFLLPFENDSYEVKFKTVLAYLLTQENLREYFFTTPSKKEAFIKKIYEAAVYFGIPIPALSPQTSSYDLCCQLTTLPNSTTSLIENPSELRKRLLNLSEQEKKDILFFILKDLRSSLTSILEVNEGCQTIEMTTKYAKYHVSLIDSITQEVHFEEFKKSLPTNTPNLALNQRAIFVEANQKHFCTYCETVETNLDLLGQIFFILNIQPTEKVFLLEKKLPHVERVTFHLVSFYSWNEMEELISQHTAIEKINGKVLKIISQKEERYVCLNFFMSNITLSNLNLFPSPSATQSVLNDKNVLSFIPLIYFSFNKLNIYDEKLSLLFHQLETLNNKKAYLEKEKMRLQIIDDFIKIKNDLIDKLNTLSTAHPLKEPLLNLLKKKYSNPFLKGIDDFITLHFIIKELDIHPIIVGSTVDRLSGAEAANCAQYAYRQIQHYPFNPQSSSEKEKTLFKTLYTLYFMGEESVLAALGKGFKGEDLSPFPKKNLETSKYLIH